MLLYAYPNGDVTSLRVFAVELINEHIAEEQRIIDRSKRAGASKAEIRRAVGCCERIQNYADALANVSSEENFMIQATYGWQTYRARSPYGWVFIGAKSPEEALQEARRSTPNPTDLQFWNGCRYIPVDWTSL